MQFRVRVPVTDKMQTLCVVLRDMLPLQASIRPKTIPTAPIKDARWGRLQNLNMGPQEFREKMSACLFV
jgi:hypothetical protein